MRYAASQFTPFWFSSNDLPGRDQIAVAASPRVHGAGSMRWAALMLMGAIGAASDATPAHAGTPSQGMPTCEEFSHTWEPSELPQTMLAAMAFAQEKVAAKDCVEKQDIATASSLRSSAHTDNQGTPEYNLGLSQRRAASVASTLVAVYGIDGSRLTSEGAGLTQPIAPNDSEEGRSKNRRVELVSQ